MAKGGGLGSWWVGLGIFGLIFVCVFGLICWKYIQERCGWHQNYHEGRGLARSGTAETTSETV